MSNLSLVSASILLKMPVIYFFILLSCEKIIKRLAGVCLVKVFVSSFDMYCDFIFGQCFIPKVAGKKINKIFLNLGLHMLKKVFIITPKIKLNFFRCYSIIYLFKNVWEIIFSFYFFQLFLFIFNFFQIISIKNFFSVIKIAIDGSINFKLFIFLFRLFNYFFKLAN